MTRIKISPGFLLAIAAAAQPLTCWSNEPAAATPQAKPLEWIRVSDDKTHFVADPSGHKLVMWGVNYDHDDPGRLLEDYWDQEWAAVV